MVAPRNFSSASYSPNQVPNEAKDLSRYLEEELNKISAAISLVAAGHLDLSYTEPTKRQDGDIRYAAGTPFWNPGSGRGVYIYKLSTWTFLG